MPQPAAPSVPTSGFPLSLRERPLTRAEYALLAVSLLGLAVDSPWALRGFVGAQAGRRGLA